MHVAIIGTYPPTRCGIATFTADVESALTMHDTHVTIVPIQTSSESPHPLAIDRDDRSSYERAARQLNQLQCDVVLIEHEFGIFGGQAGSHVLDLTQALTVPYAVTMHTVLPRFSDAEARLVQVLCERAVAVTVFTNTARRLMLEQELVAAKRLHVVPHGAPAELYADVDNESARLRLNLPAGIPIMSTFGLLSEGKGIELAIRAMQLLAHDHPDLRYVVAGRTHPEVVKREGERYRQSLSTLAEQLGVGDRVVFLDRFLDLDDLADLLGISDVVCTPYRGEDQSVSGVLTFALAAGCPIASTPFRYARDVLADGAGVIAEFNDTRGFADAIHHLLDAGSGAQARSAARRASSQMAWPTVGAALLSVLADSITRAPEPALRQTPTIRHRRGLEPVLAHLVMLCDETAILQHACFNVPRLEDGYCVDDAGRMLPIAAACAASTGDEHWNMTTGRLLAFLRASALDGDGMLRNFMSWDRRWLDQPHLGDHVGRAIWGLGELIATHGRFTELAQHMLDQLAPAVMPTWPTKSLAYAALGLVAASQVDPTRDNDLDRILDQLRTWEPSADVAWPWFESRLTYDNARVPEVLLRVGHHTADPKLVDHGAAMLEWLDRVCRQGEHYRFPGHRGLTRTTELNWSGDEQPLEASAIADAHLAWFRLSGEKTSIAAIDRAWTWFLGNNRLGEPMVDETTGAGFDGLGACGSNKNSGAESTIAFHRCRITRDLAQQLGTAVGFEAATSSLGDILDR
jgi:glycosyltransferase involved in cell wall biosynthesis